MIPLTLALTDWTAADWQWLLVGALYVLLAVGLVLAAKWLLALLTPYQLDHELFENDNPAAGVAVAGYFAAVVIIFLGVTVVPSEAEVYGVAPDWPQVFLSMGGVILWTLGGIGALNMSRLTSDKLILVGVPARVEILRDRNVGTGAAEAGCLLASGLIVAGAINGDGNILTAIVFYVLGQIALVLFARVYRLVAGFDVLGQIEADNHAAGLALGLNLVALGIVLMQAVAGDFVGWGDSLLRFGLYAILGPIVLLALRWVVDLLLVPKTTLPKEIAADRSLAAAWIEGTLAVGVATVIFFML